MQLQVFCWENHIYPHLPKLFANKTEQEYYEMSKTFQALWDLKIRKECPNSSANDNKLFESNLKFFVRMILEAAYFLDV